jgi:hypothetical protein
MNRKMIGEAINIRVSDKKIKSYIISPTLKKQIIGMSI